MVLDAFGVFFRRLPPDAEGEKKIEHEAVALTGVGCESAAFLREEDGSVGFARRKTIAHEALHGADDRGGSDAEALGEVRRTCLATRGDQIVDHLDIILGKFRLVRRTHPGEAPDLPCRWL